MWLLVDLNDDGKFANSDAGKEVMDARGPVTLDGKNYEPEISNDGSEVLLRPTKRSPYELVSRLGSNIRPC